VPHAIPKAVGSVIIGPEHGRNDVMSSSENSGRGRSHLERGLLPPEADVVVSSFQFGLEIPRSADFRVAS
jgi:hypothetical protein